MQRPSVSVIIPVYRDAAVIEETVALLTSYFTLQEVPFELILVHDGGPDATRELVQRLEKQYTSVRVIDRVENFGKGRSVREGLRAAIGDVLIYTDADLPYDLASLSDVFAAVRSGQTDLALASRRFGTPAHARHQNPLRRMTHDAFAALVARVFSLPCSDTQAGLKAMTPAVRDRVLPMLSVDRYAFDVELALTAHRQGFRLQDIPATRRATDGTNVRILHDSWNMLLDLWRIWRRQRTALSSPVTWRMRLALVAALATLALFGLWHIPTSPAMWLDDGSAASVAKNLAEHGVYGMQIAPGAFVTDMYWLTIQHPVIVPVAFAFFLFGSSVFVAKVVMVLYMAATLLMAYVFIRDLVSPRVAVWSAWLLVTFSPFYGNGKAMLGETPGIFWMLLGSWCWLRALRAERHTYRWWLSAGIAFGLCTITKPYYLLVLPAVGIAELIRRVRNRSLYLAQGAALGLPIIACLSVWFLQVVPRPVTIESVRTMGRFFSNSYGDPITSSLIVQNALRFLTESTPLHLTLLVAVILLSLFVVRPQRWEPPLMALGLFIGLTLFWYTKTPGWYRYFYSIHVLLLVLMPAALWRLEHPRLRPWIKRAFLLTLLFLQLGVTIRNIDLYQSHSLFGLQRAVAEHVPNQPLFVAHAPEAAMVLPSEHFSQVLYINPTLTVGTNELLEGRLPKVVITASAGAVGVPAIEPILQTHYSLRWAQGHYRLFERIHDVPMIP